MADSETERERLRKRSAKAHKEARGETGEPGEATADVHSPSWAGPRRVEAAEAAAEKEAVTAAEAAPEGANASGAGVTHESTARPTRGVRGR